MKAPIISIIVPVYNTEKYIARCLENLINQTFRDIEIICVNDGSPDNALAICEDYAKQDDRIVLLSQTNQGLSAARNTGLLHAQGKYIQFCDSDDYFDLSMCEKLHAAISLSNADLAVSGTRIIYEQSHIVPGDDEYYRIKSKGLTTINEAVFKNTNVHAWNKIFRKSIIDAYNIKFPVGLYYEDACFFSKYLFVSKTIYCVPECLYTYIRRENSIMGETFRKTPKAIDHIKILEDIKNFLAKNNLNGSYETNVFLWLVIAYMRSVVRYGVESIYDPAVKIASDLLIDISTDSIKKCPNIFRNDKSKLIALKNNDTKLFLQLETTKSVLKKIVLPFFPQGSKRRAFLKKAYEKVIG